MYNIEYFIKKFYNYYKIEESIRIFFSTIAKILIMDIKMEEFEIFEIVNILGLIIGLTLGAIAQKSQFCFSGSIKDYILTKSTMRGSSVLMAAIVAIIATQIVGLNMGFDYTESQYHSQNINYFTLILGAALFGIGMTYADGCSTRHLVKFAQGDKNSLIVIVFTSIFAIATAQGFIYEKITPITQNETLLAISASIGNFTLNVYAVLTILIILLALLVKKVKRVFSLYDGVIVGLLVACAWAVTGFYKEESFDRIIQFIGLSFVNPNARSIELFMSYEIKELTFGISTVFGVLIGAFIMSKFNKKYSFGCTAAGGENRVLFNMFGGALMGIGGILAMGCTVGQGLTGISTLAFASFIAIITILISGTITALILNKRNQLPMCFIFEWKDSTKGSNNIDYQI